MALFISVISLSVSEVTEMISCCWRQRFDVVRWWSSSTEGEAPHRQGLMNASGGVVGRDPKELLSGGQEQYFKWGSNCDTEFKAPAGVTWA